MKKKYDPEVAEYERKITDAREGVHFYIDLARSAKRRGDVVGFVGCWYKMRFKRLTAQYWTLALHQRHR